MAISDFFISVDSLPNDFYGFMQLLFLFFSYGYILMYASNLISDGSELLLLVPAYAGIVGSIVLPILGAVPDGCIVLFSGMGPDAQNQLSVGVGALAGSTIMLLTIPWFLSVYGGRVNYNPETGVLNYKNNPKLFPATNTSLTRTGIAISPNVQRGGYIMIGTSLTYILLQGPGVYYQDESIAEVAQRESHFAFAGMICCFVLFCWYLKYQMDVAESDEKGGQVDRRNEVIKDALLKGEVTLLGAMKSEFGVTARGLVGENTPLVLSQNSSEMKKLEVS